VHASERNYIWYVTRVYLTTRISHQLMTMSAAGAIQQRHSPDSGIQWLLEKSKTCFIGIGWCTLNFTTASMWPSTQPAFDVNLSTSSHIILLITRLFYWFKLNPATAPSADPFWWPPMHPIGVKHWTHAVRRAQRLIMVMSFVGCVFGGTVWQYSYSYVQILRSAWGRGKSNELRRNDSKHGSRKYGFFDRVIF